MKNDWMEIASAILFVCLGILTLALSAFIVAVLVMMVAH